MRCITPKIIVALAACVLTGAPAARAQDEVRVMSFNIRYGTARDGDDAWPLRRAQLFALLRREAPDILGLQEALRGQLDEVRAALPGYGEAGVGRDDGRTAGEYAAVLWRMERFELLATGDFWFSDTPALPGSRSWGNAVTRLCTWVRLRNRATGRTVSVFNVHLDHESQPSRERSAAMLLARIALRGNDDPVLVTGDFNAGEDNPAVAAVRERLRDSYRVARPADTVVGTFHAFRGDSTGEKIDYVFVSPEWSVLDAAIRRTSVAGRYPSDHFPVTARLRLAAAAPVGPELEGGALEGITVSATRSDRRIEDEPVRVEVVDAEEVQEKLQMTPGDITMLLNETGGLRVVATAPSLGGASVRIQGLRGRYTRVLADGLPLYGPTGGLGLLQIPPMDLAQVEVVKGTASAMYGGSALGGVINLVSRQPGGGGELLLNATTLGGQDAVLWLEGPARRTSWTLLAGAHRQDRADRDADGWTDVAGYRRAVVRPRVFLNDGAGRTLMATAGLTAESREGGTLPGAVAPDARPWAEGLITTRADLGVVARAVWGSRLVAARASGMVQRHEHTFGATVEPDRHAAGFAEVTVIRPGTRVSWLTGVALDVDDYASDSVAAFDYSHVVPGVFAQVEADPMPRLGLAASVRLDRHNVYGAFVSPRLSALWRAGGSWVLRVSGGSGYFAPTPFTEETEAVGLGGLLGPTVLRAERAWNASADVSGLVGPLEITAAVFRSEVSRPVYVGSLAQPQPQSTGAASLYLGNGAWPTRTSGVDVVARWRRDALLVVASATWIRSTQDPLGTGRVEAALNPRHTLGLVGMWERGRTKIGVEAYYTGVQTLDDNPYRAASRDYLVAGALIEHRVGRVRLFVNFENLGDARMTRWQPLVRPTRSFTGAWATEAWAPLEGRVVNGGVRVALR